MAWHILESWITKCKYAVCCAREDSLCTVIFPEFSESDEFLQRMPNHVHGK